MEYQDIVISRRERSGKGECRRIRAGGLVPGIIYGRQIEEPMMISFDPRKLKKAMEGRYGRNTVLNIKVEGLEDGGMLAMMQDYQIHPVSRKMLHVDFITVSPDREVEVEVPIKTAGKAIGVQKGGFLMGIIYHLKIACLPEKIPAEIVIDVTALDIGGTLKVSDLTLPEGVRSILPPGQPVISITTVREEKEAAAVAAEEAEAAAAPAEGEAAPAEKEEKRSKEKKEKEEKEEEGGKGKKEKK